MEEIEALRPLYKDLDFLHVTHDAENLFEDKGKADCQLVEQKLLEMEEMMKLKEAEIQRLNEKTHDEFRLAEEEVKRIRKSNETLERHLEVKDIEIKGLQDEIKKLSDQTAQIESEWGDKYKLYKVNLESKYKKEMGELEEFWKEKNESDLKDLIEKHKQDMEGLRSRYKFMTSVELTQKSPSSDSEQVSTTILTLLTD